MSNEKNLGDDLNDMLDGAKDGAKKASDTVNESASDFAKGANEVLGAENKKLVAGIVAILIGSLGIHKFILGYTKEGIIQLVATFVTCGIASIIPFIEGIIYLTKSDEEFYNTYQVGKKGWF